MSEVFLRKMQLRDHISIKKNIFPNKPSIETEIQVIENVVEMNSGKSNWIYYVAELEGEVVGTMFIKKDSSHISNHVGEIYTVLVGSKYRKQGICREMFVQISKIAVEMNITKLILGVRKGTTAEKVYQKLGFIKYGELPNGFCDQGIFIDKCLYYLDLK